MNALVQDGNRLALAFERIAEYEGIEDVGGRNGAITGEVARLAGSHPVEALEIAESRHDISLRINCLAVVGRETREIAPLFEARAMTEGADLERKNRNDKLSRIAIFSAGIDNAFAADTARAVPWPNLRAETQDYLSIILTPSMRQAIEEDRLGELEGYHDLVFRALGLARDARPVSFRHLRVGRRVGYPSLDPVRHGGRFLEAVSPEPVEFSQLIDLVGSTAPPHEEHANLMLF